MVNVGKYIGHIYPMGIEKQFQSKYLGICFCVERTTVMTGTHRIDKTAHETASSACLWPASCLGHVGPTAAAHVKGSMAVRLMSEFQKMWANARTWMCVGLGGAKQIPPPLEFEKLTL